MSAESADPITSRLLEGSKEYRKLHDEHVSLKDRVIQFEEKRYLTPKEEFELVRLKKQKLAGKDKMYKMTTEFKELHPS